MKLLRTQLNKRRLLAWLTAMLFAINSVVPGFAFAQTAQPEQPASDAAEPQLVLRTDLAASWEPTKQVQTAEEGQVEEAAPIDPLKAEITVKGKPFEVTFNGQNAADPYSLGRKEVAPGSETVWRGQTVGGQVTWKQLRRDIEYYILSYEDGLIGFSKAIPVETQIKVKGWAEGAETQVGRSIGVVGGGKLQLSSKLRMSFSATSDPKKNLSSMGLRQEADFGGLKFNSSYYTSGTTEQSYRTAYTRQLASKMKSGATKEDLANFKPEFSDARQGTAFMVDNGALKVGKNQVDFFYRKADKSFTLTDTDQSYLNQFASTMGLSGTKAADLLEQVRGREMWGVKTGMSFKDTLSVSYNQLSSSTEGGASGDARMIAANAKLGSMGSLSYTVREVDAGFDFSTKDEAMRSRFTEGFGVSGDAGKALNGTRGSKVSILASELAPSDRLKLSYKSFSTQYGEEKQGSASVANISTSADKLQLSLRYRKADGNFNLNQNDENLWQSFRSDYGIGGNNAGEVVSQVRDRSYMDLNASYKLSPKLGFQFSRNTVDYGKQSIGRANAKDTVDNWRMDWDNGPRLKVNYATTNWKGHDKLSGTEAINKYNVLSVASQLPVAGKDFSFNYKRELTKSDSNTRDVTSAAETLKQSYNLEGTVLPNFKLKADLVTTGYNSTAPDQKSMNVELWGQGRIKGLNAEFKEAPILAYRTRDNIDGVTTREALELNGPGFKLGDRLTGNFNYSRTRDNGEVENTFQQLGVSYELSGDLKLNLAYRNSEQKAIGPDAKNRSLNVWAQTQNTKGDLEWAMDSKTRLSASWERLANQDALTSGNKSLNLNRDVSGLFGLGEGSSLAFSYGSINSRAQTQKHKASVSGVLKLGDGTTLEGEYSHWRGWQDVGVSDMRTTKKLKLETTLDFLGDAKLSYNYGANPLEKKDNKDIVMGDKAWRTLMLTGSLDQVKGLTYSFAIQNGRNQAGANYDRLTQLQLNQSFGNRQLGLTLGTAGFSNTGGGSMSDFYSFSYQETLKGGQAIKVTLTDDPGRFSTKNGTEIWAEYSTDF